MATYNITNQQITTLQARIDDAKVFLESRRALWNALSPEKKRQWAENCPDPVISRMIALYKFLRSIFGEIVQ